MNFLFKMKLRKSNSLSLFLLFIFLFLYGTVLKHLYYLFYHFATLTNVEEPIDQESGSRIFAHSLQELSRSFRSRVSVFICARYVRGSTAYTRISFAKRSLFRRIREHTNARPHSLALNSKVSFSAPRHSQSPRSKLWPKETGNDRENRESETPAEP